MNLPFTLEQFLSVFVGFSAAVKLGMTQDVCLLVAGIAGTAILA